MMLRRVCGARKGRMTVARSRTEIVWLSANAVRLLCDFRATSTSPPLLY